MKELFYYTSEFLDPESGNIDGSDDAFVKERAYTQYRCDLILSSIGSRESANNIDMFLDEIEEDLHDEALFEFYVDVFNRLIEVYKLDILQDYADNKRTIDYSTSVKNLLVFFEKGYREFVIDYIAAIWNDAEIVLNYKTVYAKLLNNWDNYRQLYLENIKHIKNKSMLALVFFVNAQKDDICYCIMRLIHKDKIWFYSNFQLKLYERSDI